MDACIESAATLAEEEEREVLTVALRARHKFNARRVELDGIKFDSKLEGNYYLWLKRQQERGELVFFLRQQPIHLPGGTKLVVDFTEFWADGEVKFTDVKGMETPEFKIKRREVEALYPITINVVKKIPA